MRPHYRATIVHSNWVRDQGRMYCSHILLLRFVRSAIRRKNGLWHLNAGHSIMKNNNTEKLINIHRYIYPFTI